MPTFDDIPKLEAHSSSQLIPTDMVPVWDSQTNTIKRIPASELLGFDISSDGGIVADFRLQTYTEPSYVLPAGAQGLYGGALVIGDGITAVSNLPQVGYGTGGGGAPADTPTGMARIVSIKDSGNITIRARSTTGYIAVRDWAGVVTVFGSGVASTQYTQNLAVPASGAWSKSAPKELYIWSCTAGDATQSGALTYLSVSNNQLTSFSGVGLSALTILGLNNNQLTSFSGVGLSALTQLYLDNNQLTSFSGVGLSALTLLYLDNNQLTTIDMGGANIGANPYASEFRNNLLSAPALNAFFTSLGAGAATLDVANNPGSATCDPTIATAKGYTVTGV